MIPHSITILPNGTVTGLYTDAAPLAQLGKMTIRRASQIEFNESSQLWEVLTPDGQPGNADDVLYTNASRENCLSWERQNEELLLCLR